jgi:hypothetical protein
MAAKKQPKRKNGRAKATASASGHFPIVLSTAVWSALNMTAVVTTSGSVLLFLLTEKPLLVIAPREQVYRGSLILSLQVKIRIWLTTVPDCIT